MHTTPRPPVYMVLIMLFLVYISWGSTYLGNQFGLQVLGPFLLCGVRMMPAGLLLALYVAVVERKWRWPTFAEWRWHVVLALLMVVVASGFLSLGQTRVTSSVAAVIASSTPITMLIAGYLFAGEPRPNKQQCLGMVLGAIGIMTLSLAHDSDAGSNSLLGIVIVLLASVGWVAGSLLTKLHPLKSDKPMAMLESIALLLFLGGLESFLIGLGLGEQHDMHWERLNTAIILSYLWLVFGASIIAYVSYLWLLRNVPISVAISYEYVVPVVGIFLAWAFAGEEIVLSTKIACVLTICSVFLVVRYRHRFKTYVRYQKTKLRRYRQHYRY